MQCKRDDVRFAHQSSLVKKVLAGDAVHPYYYVAVLLYIIGRHSTDRKMIDELFEELKQLFLESLKDSHPPSPSLLFLNVS